MIQAEIITDTDVLDALQTALHKAPDITRYTVNKVALPRIRDKARELLRPTIPPVRYPIAWESARQRRYVMAKLRRENNLPYQRTGKLLSAWEITSTPIDAGLDVSFSNPVPYAKYVIGDRQQRFHKNTGWYQVDDQTIALSEFAINELIEAWYSIDWLANG